MNLYPYRSNHIIRIATTVSVLTHAVAVITILNLRPFSVPDIEGKPLTVSLIALPAQAEQPQLLPEKLPAPRVVPHVRATTPREVPIAMPEAPPPQTVVAAAVPAPPSPPKPASPAVPPAAAAIATTTTAVTSSFLPVVTPPNFAVAYLDNPRPIYPELSRRIGEQGKVLLRVFVDPAGNVEKVELNASSGSPRLDASALETVKRWRFVPAREGEHRVSAWIVIPILFALES